jgi:hypothetical protein
MVVLREGTNGFTCMPEDPKVIGQPAMCEDAASMQWGADFRAHKPKPTNTVPGITYMLAGATSAAIPTVRQNQPADHCRPALDDHVALRPEGHRSAHNTPGQRRMHPVGGFTLCASPRHGAP